MTFDCRCAAFEAKIATDKESVTRALAIGQRYRIYWNAAEKRWDIGAIAQGPMSRTGEAITPPSD